MVPADGRSRARGGQRRRLARRLQSGAVGINVHSAADATLPYGRYKQSGWGRERGYTAIEMYTEVKAVTLNLN